MLRSQRSDGFVGGYEFRPPGSPAGGTPQFGNAAIIWHSQGDGVVAEWRIDTEGVMSAGPVLNQQVQNVAPSTWDLKAMADLNNDGIKDMVWQESTTGGVYYWLLVIDGTRSSGGTLMSSVPGGFSIAG